ncbi:hypothetical protein [Pseudomonas helleri]|uniref:hypothetical protein n=1 Tax=Pseudomonas helleri TaxID=1608996 RepID=UPI00129670C8|nr:hypothetical protein [Pseudomonas helleri]MQT39008.1 hypothetical protein [Pseudomonas helleri]MQU24786.1 hypothetical protein [Pseudomonas helleri]
MLIQKEKALQNNFSILEKGSESAQKYIIDRINEVSQELDQLKLQEQELSSRINTMHLASKSSLNVMEIYKLLLTEHGRMRVNNFLQGQAVKLVVTPIQKKHFFIDIYLGESYVDRVHVTPDGYTAENKPNA